MTGINAGNVVSIPPSPGALLVAAVGYMVPDSIASIVDDAGGAFVRIPTSYAIFTGNEALELWYVADLSGSARLVTINMTSGMSPYVAVLWDVANLAPTNPLDTALAVSNGPASMTPAAPPISTAVAGEFVVAASRSNNHITDNVSGSPFTQDVQLIGDGWSHLTSPLAPAGEYQSVWAANTSDIYNATVAAFLPAP